MTREQTNNYLKSSGFSDEQIETVAKAYTEPKWDRLYNWLNDMRYGIAPDENTPDDERREREAQVDVIDDIMEWIEKHPQEPKTEPCEDCISRKDLLKKCVYTPIAPVIKGDSVHYEDIVFARDIINAEPISQEPKSGHWIENPNAYECSECQIIRAKGTTGKYNYCPNCGCRMVEPQERSE